MSAPKDSGLEQTAHVTYVYIRASLHEAWKALQGLPVADEESALAGVRQLKGISTLTQLRRIHETLEHLTFGWAFQERLQGVTLPSCLQSLRFGGCFNQSLEGVTLPISLQTLTFGYYFNHDLMNVKWPGSLQSLEFGCNFNQSLDLVNWPESLQKLTFGYQFNQMLTHVTWPSSLQTLNFWREIQSDFSWCDLARQHRNDDVWH